MARAIADDEGGRWVLFPCLLAFIVFMTGWFALTPSATTVRSPRMSPRSAALARVHKANDRHEDRSDGRLQAGRLFSAHLKANHSDDSAPAICSFLPAFVVAGVVHGGTTFLQAVLSRHSRLRPGRVWGEMKAFRQGIPSYEAAWDARASSFRGDAQCGGPRRADRAPRAEMMFLSWWPSNKRCGGNTCSTAEVRRAYAAHFSCWCSAREADGYARRATGGSGARGARAQIPLPSQPLFFDRSAGTFLNPRAAALLPALVPNVKIIVSLRDPVDRVASALRRYKPFCAGNNATRSRYFRRLADEASPKGVLAKARGHIDAVAAAVAAATTAGMNGVDPGAARRLSASMSSSGFLGQSLYNTIFQGLFGTGLQMWLLSGAAPGQFLFVHSVEMKDPARRESVLNRVQRFVGVPLEPLHEISVTDRHANAGRAIGHGGCRADLPGPTRAALLRLFRPEMALLRRILARSRSAGGQQHHQDARFDEILESYAR